MNNISLVGVCLTEITHGNQLAAKLVVARIALRFDQTDQTDWNPSGPTGLTNGHDLTIYLRQRETYRG